MFLKHLFRHKNKDLSRALKQALPFLEKELNWSTTMSKKFDKLELKSKKVYLLSPEDLLDVYNELTDK